MWRAHGGRWEQKPGQNRQLWTASRVASAANPRPAWLEQGQPRIASRVTALSVPAYGRSGGVMATVTLDARASNLVSAGEDLERARHGALDRFLRGVERRALRMVEFAVGEREDALELVQEA